MTKQECFKILESLKLLKKNWDSYKAKPLSKAAIEKGLSVCYILIDNGITDFEIFPTNFRDTLNVPSIQFERGEDFIDITCFETSIVIYKIRPRSSLKVVLTDGTRDEILNVLDYNF